MEEQNKKTSYKTLQNGSDIRGIALEGVLGEEVNLTEQVAKNIARGFAVYLSETLNKEFNELVISIGRDPRLSGECLSKVFSTALSSMDIKVLNSGLASTPAMFMSTVLTEFACDGAVMITASHLPWNRNGFKFFTRNGGLDKKDIKFILEKAQSFEFSNPYFGSEILEPKVGTVDIIEAYSLHLRNIIVNSLGHKDKPLNGLSIAVDAGNGGGGFFAEKVLKPLGADISGSRFLVPDGNFPNHQPNPENKEAMESIKAAVMESKADLGLIFDTDVDRSSAVDEKGGEINRNGIVAMAAALIASDNPGTTVVTDSITSTELTDFLENRLGLKHLPFKRGYKNVISKSQELNQEGIDSQLAIETSGHGAYKENYFLDDGAYLAMKIVIETARLKSKGLGISTVIEDLQEPLEAKEFRFPILTQDFSTYGDRVLKDLENYVSKAVDESVSLVSPNYEGVRIDFGHGWCLLRKSLHDPIMPLNVESNKKSGIIEIAEFLKSFLKEYTKLDISSLDS